MCAFFLLCMFGHVHGTLCVCESGTCVSVCVHARALVRVRACGMCFTGSERELILNICTRCESVSQEKEGESVCLCSRIFFICLCLDVHVCACGFVFVCLWVCFG